MPAHQTNYIGGSYRLGAGHWRQSKRPRGAFGRSKGHFVFTKGSFSVRRRRGTDPARTCAASKMARSWRGSYFEEEIGWLRKQSPDDPTAFG